MSDLTEAMEAAREEIVKTTNIINTPETERRFGIEGTFNLYSVGMKDNHDLPDLEMRGIPGMMIIAAVETINSVNAYRLVSDQPVLVGQHLEWRFGDIQTEQGDDWDGSYPHKAEDMIRLTSAMTTVHGDDCLCCQFENSGVTE
mgnify:FL=1